MLVYGFIGPNEAVDERAFIQAFQALTAKHPTVTLRLNSGGGSVFSGIPIYNAIASSAVPVNIVVEGMAASMASILLQAAGSGRRRMYKNARIMVHKPSGGAAGSAQHLRQTADLLDSLEDTLAAIYAERTGQPAAVVNTWLMEGQDRWFTAAEARAYGLVDEIVDADPAAPAAPTKSLPESAMYAHYRAALAPTPTPPVSATPLALAPATRHAMHPNDKKTTVLLNLLAAQGTLLAAHQAPYLELARGNYDATVTVLAALVIPAEKQAVAAPQASWDFDRWRREAPTGLARMQTAEPDRFDALKDLFVAALRRKNRQQPEAPAARHAVRQQEKQSWSFDKLRREAPELLEQMRVADPARLASLKNAHQAELRAKK